jgi:hypothetical protein
VKKSFNVQELLHHKPKRHGTKAHAPILVESFPTTPKEHNLKHLSLVDVIITKNKTIYLPS